MEHDNSVYDIPVIDLVISPPYYDINDGSSFITLVYKRVQGVVYVEKNENEEDLRDRITKHFKELINPETERVVGVYFERYGPVYPLDVIIRLPSAWSTDNYYLCVVPRTERVDKIVKGELYPSAPRFDIDSLFLSFGEEKRNNSLYLTSIFRAHGHVRCILPDRYWNVYKKAKVMIEEFFSFPVETKNKYIGTHDTGYVPDKVRREIFHVHRMLFTQQGLKYFPDDIIPGFSDVILNLYEAAKNILVEFLLAIMTSLGFPKSYIYSIIDEGFKPFNYATSMRLFQYNPVKEDAKWSHKLQCFEHADTTLLTFNPCTTPAEVEMVDRASGTWQIAEANADEREVIIFPGVYLAWLSGGYIQAPLHRVKHTSNLKRISTPFFLRCPKETVLDRTQLGDTIAPSAPRTSIKITDFLRDRKDVLELIANEKPCYPPKPKQEDSEDGKMCNDKC